MALPPSAKTSVLINLQRAGKQDYPRDESKYNRYSVVVSRIICQGELWNNYPAIGTKGAFVLSVIVEHSTGSPFFISAICFFHLCVCFIEKSLFAGYNTAHRNTHVCTPAHRHCTKLANSKPVNTPVVSHEEVTLHVQQKSKFWQAKRQYFA